MSINTTLNTAASTRLNKTFYDRQLLESAKTRFVHARYGQKRPIPRNSGKRVEFRKWNLFDANDAMEALQEGVTPASQALSQSNVEVEVAQYGAYVEVSDLLDMTGYDQVISESAELLGEQLGTVVEWVTRDAMNAGTNVQYANDKAARCELTAADKLTVNEIRRAVRTLKKAKARPFGEEGRKPHFILYYITKGGLCRFNGVTAGETADARRIRLLLSGADVSESKGAAARNKLYYTFGDSQGGGIIEYDLLRRTYMLRRGFTACDIASWDGRLYILDSDRHVCLFDDGISYDGKKIEAWWRTPKTDLFDKSGVKAMRSLCFRGCSLAGETALCAEVSVGGGKSSARVLLSEEEDEVTELPLKNQGRSFSLRLSNEAGGRFSLRGGLELSFESWRRTE